MSYWESSGKSDEYYTPKYIFDALGCKFDTDVASPVYRKHCHVPATNFITENSLDLEWNGFCWMNPPFGKRNSISNWLTKMYSHGNGIALTPDRTSAEWYQVAIKQCNSFLLVNHKIKFIKADGSIGKQPSNGTTLFAYGKKATDAIVRASVIGNIGYYFFK